MRLSIIAAALCSSLFMQTAAYSNDEFCPKVGQLAGLVMEGRQIGVVMSTAMNATSDETEMGKLHRNLIIEAYKSPRYSTQKMQDAAIVDFRNDAELDCYASE